MFIIYQIKNLYIYILFIVFQIFIIQYKIKDLYIFEYIYILNENIIYTCIYYSNTRVCARVCIPLFCLIFIICYA